MRRFRDRQSSRLFRGGELGRMLSMVGMLVVLAMMIRKARDADTWRFLTGEPAAAHAELTAEPAQADAKTAEAGSESASEADGTAAAAEAPAIDASAADAAPPLDEDPEEQAAIADEFQVITDRAPIVKEDMFAYWRLLRWADDAKLPALLKRARTDVRYGDLILDPAAHRGELLKVRLHVLQILKHQAAPDNPLEIETYYQALGWNDSSQAWFYFCIFTDLPPGMPVGDRITEEGTFVGYFLKTITYQDGLGKGSQAPVLIGRMVWHPAPQAPPRNDDWQTTWLIGGLLLAGFAIRLVWRILAKKKRAPLTGLLRSRSSSGEPTESVEDWLNRVESPVADEAISGLGEHESNGNAPGHSTGFPPDPRLDQSEER